MFDICLQEMANKDFMINSTVLVPRQRSKCAVYLAWINWSKQSHEGALDIAIENSAIGPVFSILENCKEGI